MATTFGAGGFAVWCAIGWDLTLTSEKTEAGIPLDLCVVGLDRVRPPRKVEIRRAVQERNDEKTKQHARSHATG